MNAQELRIGNWVSVSLKSNQGRTLQRQIGCQDIVRLYEDTGSYNYDPIPLTTEILEKCGWVWNEECKSFEGKDVRMNLEYRDIYSSYTMFNYIIKAKIADNIYYLHQLQNLYYALTGEELTYNAQ